MAHLGLVNTLQIVCKLQVFRDSGHLWLDSGPPLARSWPTLAWRKPCKLYAFRHNGPLWLDSAPLWLNHGPLWLDCELLQLDKKLQRPNSANFYR